MSLPVPAEFNSELTSDRLQVVSSWLLEGLYATEDDLSSSTDNKVRVFRLQGEQPLAPTIPVIKPQIAPKRRDEGDGAAGLGRVGQVASLRRRLE